MATWIVTDSGQVWTDPRDMSELQDLLNDAIDKGEPFVPAQSSGVDIVINAEKVRSLQTAVS